MRGSERVSALGQSVPRKETRKKETVKQEQAGRRANGAGDAAAYKVQSTISLIIITRRARPIAHSYKVR